VTLAPRLRRTTPTTGLNVGRVVYTAAVVRPAVLVLVAACSSPVPREDAPASPWTEGPELPGPRLEPGVAALGQRLVVVGGFDQNVAQGLRITMDVTMFDPVMRTWSALHPAPVAWTHVNLAGSAATIYMLGGHETQQFTAKGEAYALDVESSPPQWRQLRSMPVGQERGASGIIIAPPHIYLIGGASTTAALATCLDYDFSTDTWSMLPDLPAPRSHPAVMRMSDGTLIAAGGLATLDASSAAADVWALPPGATAWQPRAAMPSPRGGCAHGTVLGQLVCAGGERGLAALPITESYDPVGDTWTSLPAMPEARAGTQGAVIANRLYVPGGSASLRFEPTSQLHVFSLLDVTE
jgi:N-acetylneuraminic acid mutarotase